MTEHTRHLHSSTLQQVKRALVALPSSMGSVTPHRAAQALLLGSRAWLHLGEREQARSFWEQGVTKAKEVSIPLRRVEVLVDAARQARAMEDADQARACMDEALHLALGIEDVWARSEAWGPLARGWTVLGLWAPLKTMMHDLATWEDPWAQYLGWQALLPAFLPSENRMSTQPLQRVVRTWEAPFVAQALREQEDVLSRPRFRDLLNTLVFRAQSLDEPFYRSIGLSAGARGWQAQGERIQAEQAVRQAWDTARHLDDATRRGEALAEIGDTWARLGKAREARRALEEALRLAKDIGYMDDRARVLKPLLEGFARLGDARGVKKVRPLVEEMGYPRFYGPLARRLVEVLTALGEHEEARQVLQEMVARMENEGHVWKQYVLLQHGAPVMEGEALAQVTALGKALPDPRYRAQALGLLAEVWARRGQGTIFPALWEAVLDLPLESVRQRGAVEVFRAWWQVDREPAEAHLAEALSLVRFPHFRAYLLAWVSLEDPDAMDVPSFWK